jgi:hypothetical protein
MKLVLNPTTRVDVVVRALLCAKSLITDFTILQCRLSLADVHRLVPALSLCRTLTRVAIEDCAFTEAGFVALLCEIARSSLKYLSIEKTGISRTAARALSACLPALDTLTLVANGLDDVSFSAILAPLPSRTPRKLCVSKNNITDASAAVLSEFVCNSQDLREVDLWDTLIGDAGMRELGNATARSLCMHSLSAWNLRLTQEGFDSVDAGVERSAVNQKMMAIMLAVSRPGSSPLARFLHRDGDTALGHRILRFLLLT